MNDYLKFGGAAVKATNALSALDLTPPEDTSTSFSPNFVIAFAQLRTKHINSWLNRQLQTVKDAARDSQALNDVLAVFSQYGEGFGRSADGKEHPGDPVAFKKLQDALKNAEDQLPKDSPLRAKLEKLRTDPGSVLNGGGDQVVIKDEMTRMIKTIENDLKAIDRSSQECQLLVSHKMGERSEILQQAASLLQAMHETAKACIQRS